MISKCLTNLVTHLISDPLENCHQQGGVGDIQLKNERSNTYLQIRIKSMKVCFMKDTYIIMMSP